MTILKKIFLALVITSSLGAMTTYSTAAVAAEKQKSGKVIIDEILSHLKAAVTAINEKEDLDVVRAHVGNARQASKHLSVGALASRVTFANSDIVRARKLLNDKNLDIPAAKVKLEEGIKQYEEMKPDVL